ncbi:MAG: hypothetical protein AMJ90_00365 [candidate division Zixibacteria bacterium SM23_73_2]|nr:MAG: hypothetical protein AMJ90_00365 [candidate division Zixibacteria bacterium SM23_73_2]
MESKEEEKVDIYRYILVLTRYRRFIFLNLVFVCVVVGIISLFLPNWYTAKTTVLPPEEAGSILPLSLSSLGGFLPSSGMSLPLMVTPSDIFAAILRSRTVAESVINKEDLMEVYDTDKISDALKELNSHTKIEVTNEGIVSLEFEDNDKNRAARVANLFVEELDRINQKTNTSKAKSTRIFVEERLSQTQKELALAEENLRAFKEKHKTIVLDEQMRAAIQGAANLKAELTLNEIQLNVLRQTMSESHPQIQGLKTRIKEIKKQLDLMEFGDSEEKDRQDKILDIPFSEVPALSLELARLTREVKIQETVFELLIRQYEQAKIQETKDTPTVQILDKAVPPERKTRPKRTFLVGIAGLASLFLSIVFVFALEYLKHSKTQNPEEFKKLEEVFSSIREDIKDLKKLFKKRSK